MVAVFREFMDILGKYPTGPSLSMDLKALIFSTAALIIGAIFLLLGLSGGVTITGNSLLIQDLWARNICGLIGFGLLATAIYIEIKLMPPLQEKMKELQKKVEELQPTPPAIEPSTSEHISASALHQFLEQIRNDRGQDNLTRSAKEFMSKGEFENAINTLEPLSEKTPEQTEYLLTAYVSATRQGHWKKAERILSERPRPFPYIQLSIKYWQIGNITKAISLCEQAKNVIDTSGNEKDKGLLSACKNSLAYYYADGEITEKAGVARQLIEEVIPPEKRNSPKDANALDTLGYVLITFESERGEIERGMAYCKKANRLGADDYLLHKHLARAHKRLAQIA